MQTLAGISMCAAYIKERDDINTRRMGKMSLAGDAPQGFSFSTNASEHHTEVY
jgi:hypothetical protein